MFLYLVIPTFCYDDFSCANPRDPGLSNLLLYRKSLMCKLGTASIIHSSILSGVTARICFLLCVVFWLVGLSALCGLVGWLAVSVLAELQSGVRLKI